MKSFTTPTLLAVLATVSTVFAAPAPAPSSVQEGNIAARAPKPTPAPAAPYEVKMGSIERMTVTIVNSHTKDIRTRHAIDPAATRLPPVGGTPPEGVIAKGTSKEYVVPWKYLGSVFVNDADGTTNEACSQIETNVDNKWMNFDVSYVTGFSVPIVCKCDGSPQFWSGCNKDLFAIGTCPPKDMKPASDHACANPHRDSVDVAGVNFFTPCPNAYRFVNDHGANSIDECKSSKLTCCVGTACSEGS